MVDISNSIVYQVYPKSFKDSDGDGAGDLRGVIEKLDYLESLGVDYLWLTPVFPSPQNDGGYDIANYTAIDAAMGTMEDMEELISIVSETSSVRICVCGSVLKYCESKLLSGK